MGRVLITSLLLLLINSVQAKTHWETLAPGLQYARLQVDHRFISGLIHAFKIDPNRYKLQLVFADDYPKTFASAKNLMKFEEGLVAVNGGFFTPQLKPLGLRINQGILHYPLRSVRWWGVFTMSKARPRLYAPGQFAYNKRVDFAIQCGPRLVAHNRIPALRGRTANRTALGITHDRHLIMMATERLPITTTELANILKASEEKGGLDCVDALNLDGGSSTQLYAHVGDFEVSVPTFVPVADTVVVVPR